MNELLSTIGRWMFGYNHPGDEPRKGGKKMVTLKKTTEGFAIVDRTGSTIATYTRARDARRGALRRGLTVAA